MPSKTPPAGRTGPAPPTAENPPPFQVGSRINVLYPPKPPGLARINSFGQLWFFPVVLSAFGFGFAGIGTLALLAARKNYGNG